ncbi:MupA/Atu3671 family FMN-dependent luciferase-like monooxygenase [Aureimonas sp. ME7]|uniref:MupA/Atu3671 family FMN-dependent luciferase-like monooxygenase n=1 Tax=Aureimonas sp. ME7 TaxID=2744252 RepID=UPI0015F3EFBE|nr:MupA/Atu3671 family FMN-dependent luciferase-like monooxygenase [Aureimonas sp. ME7]
MMGFSTLLVGDETLLVQCAEILKACGHTVSAIVTDSGPIRDYALAQGIPSLPRGADLAERLAAFRFDWLFSAANLFVLCPEILAQARQGSANFHDGPLPRYAGLNAPAWAIMTGEREHGVTWHEITAGIDAGAILASRRFEIAADDTSFLLNTRCFEAAIDAFAELVERIERGEAHGLPQPVEPGSYFGLTDRPPLAGTLRFDRSTSELDRLVRALDFGASYRNPLVTAKVLLPDGPQVVATLRVLPGEPVPFGAQPGTVLGTNGLRLRIAATDGVVEVELAEEPAVPLMPGTVLPLLSQNERQALDEAVAKAARFERAARRRLAHAADFDLLGVAPLREGHSRDLQSIDLPSLAGLDADTRVGAAAALLLLLTRSEAASFAYSDAASRASALRFPGYFEAARPLNVAAGADTSTEGFLAIVAGELAALRRHGPHLADLPMREPGLAPVRLTAAIVEGQGDIADVPSGAALAFVLPDDSTCRLVFDAARIEAADARDLAARLQLVAETLAHARPERLADLPLMREDEKRHLLFDLNDTARPPLPETTLHALIEAQVDRTPDLVAVVDALGSLTYRELEAQANRVAHALVSLGLRPGTMVGLHLSRSTSLVVAALAIAKAGGAYVPLDPMFPTDRLAYMVEDSAAPIVLTERHLLGSIATPTVRFAAIEDLLASDAPTSRPAVPVGTNDLAYVIYTSGSTGRPKGVMLEHGNVANFFAGMDERVPAKRADGAQPVWLAVTSLSFDISVLELFWTLARGFKVVVHSPEVRSQSAGLVAADSAGKLGFGLFFWGSNEGSGSQKYKLLLDGARFADANGFSAVWMPERHFHAFGGGFPNPSVTAAAVAALTRNVAIRAGSCVLPLHHPLRVAEEWAVVDNMSDGRVGLAFASGWMPEDFVLRPENAPPHNREALLRDIDTVRRLWRGEALPYPFGEGRSAAVVTQPRPIQRELPVWVTTAGNPDTWVEAARLGANVLTHLLGQSIAEVGEKIALYRRTLRETGRDPAEFKVVLMLHTLLGEDREEVRARAREPMKAYLKTAANLIKQYAWAFPAFRKPAGLGQALDIDLQGLSAEEMDAILEFAFARYFDDSGLFGTVEDAKHRAGELVAIGVDEIACLIDFGVAEDLALERLSPLAEVVAAFGPTYADSPPTIRRSVAEDIAAHRATHLQATPSMMRMFLSDDEDRRALGRLAHLFVGGEAFPAALLAELRAATDATIENMYGPTETTIWSSTTRAENTGGVVPLGTPIANTQLYVLDEALRLVPPGSPGELCIGGAGVARGYHGRPELTAERFVPNPFAPGRIYRTGDLVARSRDGTLQFLGRTDHQVKVRGYRIELGEIEERIEAFPGVAQAVVVAREDRPGDVRLVAYLRTPAGAVDETALRAHLAERLPYYMVPAHFMTLQAFPLTPNAKVDRKALPKPGNAPVPTRAPAVEAPPLVPVLGAPGIPAGEMERAVAECFARVLGLSEVAPGDSFFALGGHSLLAVQAHRELKASVAPDMAITDLFRFPTVRGLAEHLSNRTGGNERLDRVADRAAQRRAALGGRRAEMERARGGG